MLAAEKDEYEHACRAMALKIDSCEDLTLSAAFAIMKQVSSEYRLDSLPKSEHVMKYLLRPKSRRLLMIRPAKTASGVAVIAVMPKPFECPHGRCTYCPGGIEHNTPLSYTGTEPATKAAQRFDYDPFQQVQSKLLQLNSRGHETSKTELVFVGGTFPFMPPDYQKDFAKSCYDALNGFRSDNLEQAIASNEVARNRCVGLTVETKPDYCKENHIDLMLELGATRVEIGVQTLQENVYRIVNRGHTLDDVTHAFRAARESGYKIVAHMMPGLPGSSPEQDVQDFRRLFDDDSFKPDMLKIYPTLVLEGTGLYRLHASGKYHAYSDNDLIKVIVEAKKLIPPWMRIMRVQREIESKDIIAGPRSGNLRQLVLQRLRNEGLSCRCIRCREAGLQNRFPPEEDVVLVRREYTASSGKEIFLSFEDTGGKTILGFLRLRKPANPHRAELAGAAIVRELHIYGQAIGVGLGEAGDSLQHRGYGGRLLREAEEIAQSEFGVEKISVISAVGTREYYRKQGYSMDGPYVSKVL